jgi:uncharacterized membrane protein
MGPVAQSRTEGVVYAPVGDLPPPEARRALVDERGRAVPTEERRLAWQKVEQMRWWQPSVSFPATPNEYLHFRALQDWLFGFVVTSVMLLAPGVGATFLLRWQREVGGVQSALSAAVAMIALILLVLVMQRLAQPMWGAPGAPALWLRRIFLLSLPTPVLAALATAVRPSRSIEFVGLAAMFTGLAILLVLFVWFLLLYFAYTGVSAGLRCLENRTPQQALLNYYLCLRPSGNVLEAVQYQTAFRRFRFMPPDGEGTPARWLDPDTGQSRTLSELGSELARFSRSLDVANFQQDFEVAGAVAVRAPQWIPEGGSVIGCCALDASGIAGEGAGAERVSRRQYRAHRLIPFEDGWFVEPAPLPIDESEVRRIYQSGEGASASSRS